MNEYPVSRRDDRDADHAGRAIGVRERLRRLWQFLRDNELNGVDGTFF